MPSRHFFPRAICARCNKPCQLDRKVTKRGRVLEAVCHGDRAEVAFQTEPDVEVRVFGDEATAHQDQG